MLFMKRMHPIQRWNDIQPWEDESMPPKLIYMCVIIKHLEVYVWLIKNRTWPLKNVHPLKIKLTRWLSG
jgi:hypothetical protein